MRRHRQILLAVLVFGLIYSLISLVNHYNFRTYALDLGAYTNALYDYLRMQWNDSTVFKADAENLLADHFDLYLIFFSPLSLIFGTYTLLIVQIFFLINGGLGVYAFFYKRDESRKIALAAAIFYYSFFGVFSALAYDYHSNVVAACLIPWFFYFVRIRRIAYAALLLFIILVSKENVSLWMAFVCLGLCIEYIRDGRLRKLLFFASILCLLYFVFILGVLMPAISKNAAYTHFHYTTLGSDVWNATLHLLSHPFSSLQTLFTNHTGNTIGDYVKAELHVFVLLSGLPILLLRPQFILMLIPVYFQKMFHDNTFMWSIAGQYNIEFAPILALGIFTVVQDLMNEKFKKVLLFLIPILALLCTVRSMDRTTFFTDKSRIRIYQASHYTRDYDVKKVHEVLSRIPKNAIVSAQSPFLPHLALRDKIYQFPLIGDAEYIIYSNKEVYYPLDEDSFSNAVKELRESGEWLTDQEVDNLIILRKKKRG